MSIARIADVTSITMGQAPPGKECNKDGKGTIFVKAGEFGDRYPHAVEWTTKPQKLAKAGDTLVCVVGATAGKVNQAIDCAIGRSAAAVRAVEARVDPDYLYRFFETKVADLRRISQGLAQGVLTREMLGSLQIPLPPLSEQRRIVAMLDQADALRRLRRQSLSRLSDLGQAIFVSRFERGDIFPSRRISEFAYVKGGKRLPKGAEYSPVPTDHPYIRVSNLSDGVIETDGMKFITDEIHKTVARYIVRTNDVIISIAGTIGVVAPVRENLDRANLTENAAKITPKEEGAFDPDYLTWALQTPQLRQTIRANTGQVTIGKLALFRIEELSVPMPEIDVQREFARHMTRLEIKRGVFMKALAESEALFASLQHRAFRGEL